MLRTQRQISTNLLVVITLSLFISSSQAATALGCFSSIPSSYTSGTTYTWQSSSYCSEQCAGYSYFALTKGNTCSCGNEAPDSDASSSSCSTTCFGYGDETCGGDDSFNVFSNGNGGASAGSANANASKSSSTTGTSTTSSAGATATTSTSSANTATTSTTSTGDKTDGTTSGTQSTTTSPSTTTSAVSTTEVSGSTIIIYSTVSEALTQTVEAPETASTSSSANPTSSSDSPSPSSGSKSVIGPAVGGAVGGIAAIALIVVLIIFWRRRQVRNQRDAELADSAYFSALKRDGSMIATPAPGHSRQLSNPFASKEDIMVDQRLNPVMLGRRRISEGSLADEADYSRKILRVANPDDE